MTSEELRTWAEQQKRVLMDAGIDALDAERSVKWVLDHLPAGADPNTWRPTAAQLADEPIDSEAALDDARADWYANVPGKYARLLDASETEE